MSLETSAGRVPAGARAVAPAGPGAGGPAVPAERAEPARRRRGQELEDALLEAAWLQLVDAGYGSFTIDAVADRAGTSRPVLYRRWPDRESLALAAIRHAFEQAERPDFDTGSLRGDLVAYLSYANDTRLEFAAVVSAQLGSFYRDTGTSMADLRTFLLGDRSGSVMDAILDRAAARGEVDLARITPRIAAVPFDLFRLEALMTMKPVPHSAMLEIVDDIFLPLVLLPLPLPLPPA